MCPLWSGKELFLLLSFAPDRSIDGEIEGDTDNIGRWVSNDKEPASTEAAVASSKHAVKLTSGIELLQQFAIIHCDEVSAYLESPALE